MIAQLLNQEFVLAQLGAVAAHLAAEPGAHAGLLSAIRDAEAAEQASSSGQRGGLEPPPLGSPAGGVAPELDDVAFFSRNPVVSLAQSALDRYMTDHQVATVDVAEDGDPALATLAAVADQALAGIELSVAPDGRRLFGRFELADPGWVASALSVGVRQLRGRHPFPPRPATPRQIADRARLVLVGDWGSGLPRARAVANQMRRVLEQGAVAGLEQHVIHLGDVYYSGWSWEYDQRFLAYWPVAPGEADRISSWALNANHDMYSGGHGYFSHLLSDRRFSGHEGSSYFSLNNRDWEVLGLDTGWEEGGLADPQAEWVRERALTADRKLVLLSHHQLFSVYERAGAALRSKLREPLNTGRVRAWFWGHEHRCMTFRRYQGLEAGRCIGHGGVPVHMWRDLDEPCPSPAAYEYRERIWTGVEPWALCGFAVLEFDGPDINVRYIDEHGTEHFTERLT